MSNNRFKFRRATPWDNDEKRTASQSFFRNETNKNYQQRHQKLKDSISVRKCLFCGSEAIKRNRKNSNGIQKYYCIANRKILITEWIEYWRNLLQYVSLTADSWNNKNSITTAKHWFKQTCLLLEHIQDDIILFGIVCYDELFYSICSDQIIRKKNGMKPHGHTKNQMTIGVATDEVHTVIKYLGNGEPTQKAILNTFRNRIEPGLLLITDKHW